MFSPDQVKELAAPLDRANVKERTQAGRSFSYIEGWHAEAEANRIFGFDGWDSEAVDIRVVSEKARKIGSGGRDGWSVSYIAKVRVTVRAGDRLIVREGVGAGHGIDVDLGLAHESAAKEATTDAEKRALKTFGNPFGLALYDKTQANVCATPAIPVEERGLYVAARAAIDLCDDKAALEHWASANKDSMAKIAEADPEVHRALRARYAERLKEFTQAREAA